MKAGILFDLDRSVVPECFSADAKKVGELIRQAVAQIAGLEVVDVRIDLENGCEELFCYGEANLSGLCTDHEAAALARSAEALEVLTNGKH